MKEKLKILKVASTIILKLKMLCFILSKTQKSQWKSTRVNHEIDENMVGRSGRIG